MKTIIWLPGVNYLDRNDITHSHLVDWIAQTFGPTLPIDLGSVLSTVPVPPWLAVWIDPAWIQSIQSGLVSFIETMKQTVPYFASAIGWIGPQLWAILGLGTLVLLSLAIAGHLLVSSLLTAKQN